MKKVLSLVISLAILLTTSVGYFSFLWGEKRGTSVMADTLKPLVSSSWVTMKQTAPAPVQPQPITQPQMPPSSPKPPGQPITDQPLKPPPYMKLLNEIETAMRQITDEINRKVETEVLPKAGNYAQELAAINFFQMRNNKSYRGWSDEDKYKYMILAAHAKYNFEQEARKLTNKLLKEGGYEEKLKNLEKMKEELLKIAPNAETTLTVSSGNTNIPGKRAELLSNMRGSANMMGGTNPQGTNNQSTNLQGTNNQNKEGKDAPTFIIYLDPINKKVWLNLEVKTETRLSFSISAVFSSGSVNVLIGMGWEIYNKDNLTVKVGLVWEVYHIGGVGVGRSAGGSLSWYIPEERTRFLSLISHLKRKF